MRLLFIGPTVGIDCDIGNTPLSQVSAQTSQESPRCIQFQIRQPLAVLTNSTENTERMTSRFMACTSATNPTSVINPLSSSGANNRQPRCELKPQWT